MANITDDAVAFRSLSRAHQRRLAREARAYCAAYPYLRDAGGFWRTLSATHVRSLYAATLAAE